MDKKLDRRRIKKRIKPKFKEKLDSIIDKSCEGWGHKDTLLDIYEELKND